MGRTTKAELAKQGRDAVTETFAALGQQATSGADGVTTLDFDGRQLTFQVHCASVCSPEVAHRLVTAENSIGAPAPLLVADLVAATARSILVDNGWSYLDRRGHLYLRSDGVLIDTDVPPLARTVGPRKREIAGTAAISLAVALLMDPGGRPSLRSVARRITMSHTAVTAAAHQLRKANLLTADGSPLVPELFWALSDVWVSIHVPLNRCPSFDDDLEVDRLELGTSETPGWAVAGPVGAFAWGAPLVMRADEPPSFYVPSQVALRRATALLERAPSFEERACTIAVAPTPLVCAERTDLGADRWGPWRFGAGIVSALDLAVDRTRGLEVLEAWEPEGFARAW